MAHGLYGNIETPWPMGCTVVYPLHAPWTVQCYGDLMDHGLYDGM